jgi:hypothetical protein
MAVYRFFNSASTAFADSHALATADFNCSSALYDLGPNYLMECRPTPMKSCLANSKVEFERLTESWIRNCVVPGQKLQLRDENSRYRILG